MGKSLRIRFEGSAPGLADGRLSVDAFGEPLKNLLAAFRGVATQIEGDSTDDGGEAPSTGRFSKTGEQLDLQLTTVTTRCVEIELTPTTTGPPVSLLAPDIINRSLDELLASVEAEAVGEVRNRRVRRFLKSLPPTVTNQRWSLWDNGREQNFIEVGEPRLVDEDAPIDAPVLVHLVGLVVGVGFQPGSPEVRIQRSEGGTLLATATEEQVEQALALRLQSIHALAVCTGKKRRLLWILPEHQAPRETTDEQRNAHIVERWDDVLRRLSK